MRRFLITVLVDGRKVRYQTDSPKWYGAMVTGLEQAEKVGGQMIGVILDPDYADNFRDGGPVEIGASELSTRV